MYMLTILNYANITKKKTIRKLINFDMRKKFAPNFASSKVQAKTKMMQKSKKEIKFEL